MGTVGTGCSGISTALTGANLISAVVHSFSNTENAFGQPVNCAFGYTWTDGTTYTTLKSVICYYSSGTPTWYLPSCTCMSDIFVHTSYSTVYALIQVRSIDSIKVGTESAAPSAAFVK